MAVLGGVAVSYERGTPVALTCRGGAITSRLQLRLFAYTSMPITLALTPRALTSRVSRRYRHDLCTIIMVAQP